MKVKALSRSKASTERECVGDLRKQQRNLDPVYHPMQRSREMARAVTSAKMERMVSSLTLLLSNKNKYGPSYVFWPLYWDLLYLKQFISDFFVYNHSV